MGLIHRFRLRRLRKTLLLLGGLDLTPSLSNLGQQSSPAATRDKDLQESASLSLDRLHSPKKNKLDLDGLATQVKFCHHGSVHGFVLPQPARV